MSKPCVSSGLLPRFFILAQYNFILVHVARPFRKKEASISFWLMLHGHSEKRKPELAGLHRGHPAKGAGAGPLPSVADHDCHSRHSFLMLEYRCRLRTTLVMSFFSSNILRLMLNTSCSSSGVGGRLQLAHSAIHFGDAAGFPIFIGTN
jgi:hypothetical protein